MKWENIAKGGPKSRVVATALFSHLHVSKIVPLSTTEKTRCVDIYVEDLVSGRESVYRVFPSGDIDHGVEEKASRPAPMVEYHVVLTMEFYHGGKSRTETLDRTLTLREGEDAEILYFLACAKFKERYGAETLGPVLCWSFTKNELG